MSVFSGVAYAQEETAPVQGQGFFQKFFNTFRQDGTPPQLRQAKTRPTIGSPAPEKPNNGAVACTMDAKVCPDGSYVGRIGPKCEFAPCETRPSGLPLTDEERIALQKELENLRAEINEIMKTLQPKITRVNEIAKKLGGKNISPMPCRNDPSSVAMHCLPPDLPMPAMPIRNTLPTPTKIPYSKPSVFGEATFDGSTYGIPQFGSEDKVRGWYYGSKEQKRSGTPEFWIHRGEGTRSAQWYDPNMGATQ